MFKRIMDNALQLIMDKNEELINQALEEQRTEFLNQPANQHDQEVIKEYKKRLKKEILLKISAGGVVSKKDIFDIIE